jgi:serine/threonine-protein kinase
MAKTFPKGLNDTPGGKRVAQALDAANATLAEVARSLTPQVRAARNKGDFDGARSLAAKLPATQRANEEAAIAVIEAGLKNRVTVAAGGFIYGETGAEKKGDLPAFLIDKLEVSNRAWVAFARETNAATAPAGWTEGKLDPKDIDCPVTGISLEEAAAFAKWIGARVPSALEWEKAARGTDGRPYPWGKEWKKDALNWCSSTFKPCGSFQNGASPCGALDMAGNAAEWTSTVDAKGRAATKGSHRKEFTVEPFHMGNAVWLDAKTRDAKVGFRCAWDAK